MSTTISVVMAISGAADDDDFDRLNDVVIKLEHLVILEDITSSSFCNRVTDPGWTDEQGTWIFDHLGTYCEISNRSFK